MGDNFVEFIGCLFNDEAQVKLIAFANWHEIDYIFNGLDWELCWNVGFRCEFINQLNMPYCIADTDEIILFGSCGLLQRTNGYCYFCRDYGNGFDADKCKKCEYKIKNDMLISPKTWRMNDESLTADQIIDVPMWGEGVTIDYSCRDREGLLMQFPDTLIVDQESYILGKWCADRGIKFQSVRYITDRCARMYPPVINKIWKKRQHRKMQLKFLEVLK